MKKVLKGDDMDCASIGFNTFRYVGAIEYVMWYVRRRYIVESFLKAMGTIFVFFCQVLNWY